MRLLLCNPNSNTALTTTLADAMAARLGPRDVLDTIAPDSGNPPFIGSEATIATARAALSRSLTAVAATCEAVLLGCFGDLGLDELRRTVGKPIVSLSDACFAAAPLLPARIAIVTTSPFWVERLGVDVLRRGLDQRIVAITAVQARPDQPEALAPAALGAIRELAAAGTAEAVTLGGAVLEVLRPQLVAMSPLPIVDTLGLAIGLCRVLAEWNSGPAE